MCFSSTASFTAAAIVGLVGIATIKKNNKKHMALFSSIPILFAIQQLIEGLQWEAIGDPNKENLQNFLKYSYLFFAFVIWPIVIPVSVFLMEEVAFRKKILAWFIAIGILLSFYYVTLSLLVPVVLSVQDYSLQYMANIESYKWIYCSVIILPLFISSVRNIKLLACLALTSLIVAYLVFTNTFVSVWCFFAAIITICVYKIIKDNQY
ncbi:hypothetical protein BN1013_00484 [Candidatus Rubidus massiliensis]|nr:hypothetical protein BN1013_00484 [Candidatus Rubidus massiliensis]